MRHPFYFSKRRSSLPVMRHRICLLSLFLLCVISGPAPVWSQGNADETPVGPPGVKQNPDSPTASGSRLDVSSSADVSPSSIFLHGYRAFQNKDWETARAAFEHVQPHEPLLVDYSLYFLGELHLKASRPVEARAVFERLLDEYPTTVWQSHAALALARLTFAEERWEPTHAYAKQAQQAPLVTDAVRQQCTLLIAQAYEKQGKRSLAYQRYQSLRASGPRTTVGRTAKARVAALREQYPEDFPLQTARAHYDEVKLLVKEEDVETARDLAEQFQMRFSTSSLRPAGWLLLAGLYKNLGQRRGSHRTVAGGCRALSKHGICSQSPVPLGTVFLESRRR